MRYNATNGIVEIENGNMDFISFGNGDKVLIMIPGLSDGLKTVKGMAKVMAMMYKCYAKSHKVYMISRKNNLEKGYSTRDMASDYKAACEKLGVIKAGVLGVSQGGMIAQYLAIDYPELVEKLVLAVTLSKQNETVEKVVSSWIKMAEKNDYNSLFIDTAEKSYTEKRLRKYRPLYPLLSKIGKPKSFNRFIIQANACITHNAYDELDKIKCPTLVIGGDSDKVTGPGTSEEIAGKIKNSKLIIYKGLGHSMYEEAKDFNTKVMEFISSIRLRPHHLLCTQSYSGKGYDNNFTENMTAITNRLRNDDNTTVDIVFSTDDICSKCPRMIDVDLCESNEKVKRLDEKVVAYFEIAEKRYLYQDIIREINAKMTSEIMDDICSECEWYPYCQTLKP